MDTTKVVQNATELAASAPGPTWAFWVFIALAVAGLVYFAYRGHKSGKL